MCPCVLRGALPSCRRQQCTQPHPRRALSSALAITIWSGCRAPRCSLGRPFLTQRKGPRQQSSEALQQVAHAQPRLRSAGKWGTVSPCCPCWELSRSSSQGLGYHAIALTRRRAESKAPKGLLRGRCGRILASGGGVKPMAVWITQCTTDAVGRRARGEKSGPLIAQRNVFGDFGSIMRPKAELGCVEPTRTAAQAARRRTSAEPPWFEVRRVVGHRAHVVDHGMKR